MEGWHYLGYRFCVLSELNIHECCTNISTGLGKISSFQDAQSNMVKSEYPTSAPFVKAWDHENSVLSFRTIRASIGFWSTCNLQPLFLICVIRFAVSLSENQFSYHFCTLTISQTLLFSSRYGKRKRFFQLSWYKKTRIPFSLFPQVV